MKVSKVMNVWINGRRCAPARAAVDYRDRGLQYGDGLFETMRIKGHAVRLLDYHLERLYDGCRRLMLAAPNVQVLRRELVRIAAFKRHGILKLMLTRGNGKRGYRTTGRERCTRIAVLHPLPRASTAARPVRVHMCVTPIGSNPALAGLKTLNRLESIVARAEWRDARVWEGLMRDMDQNIVCGTMTNLFFRHGSFLLTPRLDRCGIAGVMRRWVLDQAGSLGLEPLEGRVRWTDLQRADEVFLCNAIAGPVSVGEIKDQQDRIRPQEQSTASQLRARLELL
jgi:4-amino-4-deoxychorismate lyase